jgi:hypothetical protein
MGMGTGGVALCAADAFIGEPGDNFPVATLGNGLELTQLVLSGLCEPVDTRV